MRLQGNLRQAFLVGLNNVLDNYIDGNLNFSGAVDEVERVIKDGDDFYENISVFGPLTVKEKICALANLSKELLIADEPSEKVCEIWAQATAWVVFEGLINTAELEVDCAESEDSKCSYKEGRTAIMNLYNELIADEDASEINVVNIEEWGSSEWRRAGEEVWNHLVERSDEPWADEDFMIFSQDYPPKTDESDFRRSLSFLINVCEKQRHSLT